MRTARWCVVSSIIAARCCGAAHRLLDLSSAYAQEREAFGRQIAQFQGVSFPLAEGEGLIAAVRQLCYHALRLRDAGAPHTAEAAMCKWWGPRLAYDTVHECLLMLGHAGYDRGVMEQRLRDVLGFQIGDGTAQIMKLIIAREKVGRVALQYHKV